MSRIILPNPCRLSIDEFVELYWPLPYHLDSRLTAEEQDRRHMQFLKGRFHPKVLEQYFNILSDYKGDEQGEQQLTDFVFETGLSSCVNPCGMLQSRELLKFLLGHLKGRTPGFSIVDLGSGAGEIAVGLALYLDNLSKIHVVERLLSGLERMDINMKNLDERSRERLAGKVVRYNSDYMNGTFEGLFSCVDSDIYLLANATTFYGDALRRIDPLMGEGCELIAAYPQAVLDSGDIDEREVFRDCVVESLVEKQGTIAKSYGLEVKLLGSLDLVPGKVLVVTSGKPYR